MNTTLDDTAFKLSRIYAEGWNAARKISAKGQSLTPEDGAGLNPYGADPQRARWRDGFSGALIGHNSH